jgi:two-component system response regulator RpfG
MSEQIQPSENKESRTVFIIDDLLMGRKVLEEIIGSMDSRLEVRSFGNPLEALDVARTFPPDLVLVDYNMPQMNGAVFTRHFREIPECLSVPVIIVTVLEDRDVRYQSLEAGATDFLTRPLDPYETRARCMNLLNLQKMTKAMQLRTDWLSSEIDRATRKIQEREQETLFILAKVGEYHDKETGNHIARMAKYSRAIAEGLGLGFHECSSLEIAAPMHDIGKIGIPDHILLKNGTFTREEYNIVKQHPLIGYEILKNSTSIYLRLGAEIALGHQERYDGSGYPHGLAGEWIPLHSRIVAVGDVFDALTTARPYKDAWSLEAACQYILDQSGKLFDPQCVAAFRERIDRIMELAILLKDHSPTTQSYS